MKISSLLLSVLLVFASGCTHPTSALPPEDAVRTTLAKMFDRPDAPLTVQPVVVEGHHAVAGWSQGALGGRALLHEKDGIWQIVLCAGPGVRDAAFLRDAGLPEATARALSARLATAEAALGGDRMRLLDSFVGVTRMHGDGSHPAPAH